MVATTTVEQVMRGVEGRRAQRAMAEKWVGGNWLRANAATLHGTTRKLLYKSVRKLTPKVGKRDHLLMMIDSINGFRVGQGDIFSVIAQYLTLRREGHKAKDALRWARSKAARPSIVWLDKWEIEEALDIDTWEPTYGTNDLIGASVIERDGETVLLEVYYDSDRNPLEDFADLSDRTSYIQDRYHPSYDAYMSYDRAKGGTEYVENHRVRYITFPNWEPKEFLAQYRKAGMSKQVAREKLAENWRDTVETAEKMIEGTIADYGCVATVWLGGEPLSDEVAVWGCDAEDRDDEHIIEMLMEEADEAVWAARD